MPDSLSFAVATGNFKNVSRSVMEDFGEIRDKSGRLLARSVTEKGKCIFHVADYELDLDLVEKIADSRGRAGITGVQIFFIFQTTFEEFVGGKG